MGGETKEQLRKDGVYAGKKGAIQTGDQSQDAGRIGEAVPENIRGQSKGVCACAVECLDR